MDASNSQEIEAGGQPNRGLRLSEKRFCTDCAHCVLVTTSLENTRCEAPQGPRYSAITYVSRDATFGLPFASIMREYEHRCGHEAKWFQPKPATGVFDDLVRRDAE